MLKINNLKNILLHNKKLFLNNTNISKRRFSNYYKKSKSFFSGSGTTIVRLSSVSFLSTIPLNQKDNYKEVKPAVTRYIRSPSDATGLTLTLYQYQSCPFCCKIRAYLDYRGFSYDIIEVNSLRRNEIKWSTYKKVPILTCSSQTNNEVIQLNDSSLIISALESFLINKSIKISEIAEYYPSIELENAKGKKVLEYPNKYYIMYNDGEIPSESDEERRWRAWTDEDLVHTISPNIYRTLSESIQTFKYFAQVGEWRKNFGEFESTLIIFCASVAMYFVGKLLKRRHNLTDDVRISMYNSTRLFTAELASRKTPFHGGQQPNLADLAVFGVLNSVEGTQAFTDLADNVRGLNKWYSAVKIAISKNVGVIVEMEQNSATSLAS